MGKTAKNDKAAQVKQMIAGAKTRFPNGSEKLTFGAVTRTVDEITGLMQSFVDLRSAVETAKAATATKVAAERAQAPSLLAIIAAFVTYVRLTFGNQADVLADFGLSPPKARATVSAEAKAVAAAKRKATREARGTTSKKAKKNVKGNVTAALVVTPAPAAPKPSTPVEPPASSTSGAAPSGGTAAASAPKS